MNLKKIALALCAISIVASQSSIMAYMKPIKKDGRYYYSEQDTHAHINLGKALSFLKRKLFSPTKLIQKIVSLFYAPQEKDLVDPIAILNPTQTVPEKSSIEPKITWIGHSTFLVQLNGFNILTDPIFGNVKVGPFTLTKRAIEPGIKFENLPHIDAIVISHNHSDHTDTNTLMALSKKHRSIIFVPEGDKALFESMGFKRVIENTWWERTELTCGERKLTISCLPAYHWSIRFSLDGYRKSLWASWMISAQDTDIYFAGDTAYGQHFKEIASAFPSIDVALMPIGPTSEKENAHKHSHVDAPEAVDAFIDLNAQCFVPMHYGTFFSGKDTLVHPINKLKAYWQEKLPILGTKKLAFLRCGEQYSL